MAEQSGRIRVAVVGLGYFGSHHARHYATHASVDLVALVDADPVRLCQATEKHGAAGYGNHRDLIGKVDAVSVAVPTPAHGDVGRDLIEAGIHVFIEKPIAANVATARDLVERAARSRTILQVGHIERFSPAFQALQAGMPRPRLIECVRRTPWTGRAADVDVVLDLMIHDIDLALALAGAAVVSVEASGFSVVTATNDVAEARLVFANGVVATLAASRVAAVGSRLLSATAPGHQVVADLGASSLSIATGSGEGIASRSVPLARADNLAAEIDAFLDSVATGKPPLVDGQAGLDALEVADMILASAARARKAAPSHPKWSS